MITKKSAKEIIDLLGLQRHPEGGWYRQTFRDEKEIEGRSYSSAIYYLLERGDKSHWHRIDAVEIWHFHAGAPLKLKISEGSGVKENILGAELEAGQHPQIIVPKGWWQAAISLGEWTLVGCTVAPGFEFSNFELAEEGFSPE